MRKTVAFVLCIGLILTVGFAIVHPAYILISDWLCPILGISLLNALSTLYLITGNPISNVLLVVLWGGAAFLAGIIIRRRGGAILTMLLVFLMIFPILAANLYEVATNAQTIMKAFEGSDPFDVLPPLPQELTFPLLYRAPIIGEAIETVLSAMQSGKPPDPWSMVTDVLTNLALSVGIKLVIIVAVAFIGVEVGKKLEPFFAPLEEAIRKGLSGKSKYSTNSPLIEAFAFLAPMLIVSAALHHPGFITSESEFYSENIICFADITGSAYVGNLFMGTETPLQSIDTEVVGELLAGIIISHRGAKEAIAGLVPSEMGVESLINIIPETIMIIAYIDSPPDQAGLQSKGVADIFAETFQVDLTQMMAFEPPLPMEEEFEAPPLTLVIYQSEAGIEDLASTYLDQFDDKGGLIELVREANEKGELVPQASPDSPDGGVIFSGFLNLESLVSYAPKDTLANLTEFIPLDQSGLLGFLGGFSYWEHGVNELGEGQGLDLLALFGTKESPDFSPESEISMVILAAPNGTDAGGEEVPNVKITTSLEEGDPRLNVIREFLEEMEITGLMPLGTTLDASAFKIEVSGVTLPLKVEITKTVSPEVPPPKGIVEVTVTVRNLDSVPMTDVELNDSSTIKLYTLNTILTSGSTIGQWSNIEPGEAKSISYNIEIGPSGIYSLFPAKVEYRHEAEEFAEYSQWLELRAKRPSVATLGIGSLISTGETLMELLEMTAGNSGRILGLASISLIIMIVVILETRNIMKWLRRE